MTNQQAPESLRPITRYEVVDCIDSKHVPAVIPNRAGPWVRYEDHIAAMVEAQQPATHVQNPVGIEHVAGDVSKNGAESNMAQQPAPSAAGAVGEPVFWMNEKGHTWSHSDWKQFPKHRAKYPIPLYAHRPAPQPSPAPQADSQPAPVAAAVVGDKQKESEMKVWFRPARMHGQPERTPIKATITKDRGNGIVDLTFDDEGVSGNARAVPNALRLPRNVREQVAVWWDVGFEMDFQTAVDNSLKKKKDDPPPQPSPTPQAPFQQRVQPWLLECFGAEIAADRMERNRRFLEESLELVQAKACTASEAHQLVDYVFGRPVGDPPQEVGGVMVTLAALCLASGLDMHDAGEVELTRISAPEVVAKIRAKQAAKPKHSPLPQSPPPQADSQPAMTPETVYAAIAHGDEEHRAWLLSALRAVWCGEAVPPVASPIANAAADSQPAPEYVGNGMFKGETIEKAAEHWANWCDVRCMNGLAEFLRVVAARAQADSQPVLDETTAMNRTRDLAESGRWPSDWVEAYRRGYSDRAASAPADSVTAPAGGGVTGPEWKWVPMDATDAMVRATDKVNFENEDTDGTIHNVWNTMLAAAPTPPAPAADSVTAPAGPSKSLPYEPTSAMLIAARERDPALPIETVRAIYWSMWRTATTPPAQAADSVLEDAARYRWLARKVSAHGICDGWQFGFPTALTLPANALAMTDPETALGQCIDAARKHGGA